MFTISTRSVVRMICICLISIALPCTVDMQFFRTIYDYCFSASVLLIRLYQLYQTDRCHLHCRFGVFHVDMNSNDNDNIW